MRNLALAVAVATFLGGCRGPGPTVIDCDRWGREAVVAEADLLVYAWCDFRPDDCDDVKTAAERTTFICQPLVVQGEPVGGRFQPASTVYVSEYRPPSEPMDAPDSAIRHEFAHRLLWATGRNWRHPWKKWVDRLLRDTYSPAATGPLP